MCCSRRLRDAARRADSGVSTVHLSPAASAPFKEFTTRLSPRPQMSSSPFPRPTTGLGHCQTIANPWRRGDIHHRGFGPGCGQEMRCDIGGFDSEGIICSPHVSFCDAAVARLQRLRRVGLCWPGSLQCAPQCVPSLIDLGSTVPCGCIRTRTSS